MASKKAGDPRSYRWKKQSDRTRILFVCKRGHWNARRVGRECDAGYMIPYAKLTIRSRCRAGERRARKFGAFFQK